MNEQINTGALISPKDYRDDIASMAAIPVTPNFSLPPSFDTPLGPVQMQGKQPACVSHSVVEIMKLYWFKKTGQWIDFSPRFLDILSADPSIPLDGGRVPRTVFKLAASIGCCTTDMLPNDVNLSIPEYRENSVITQQMRDQAAKYKIPGFVRVALDFNSMRQAVFFYGALSTLFAVGQEMYVPSWLPKDTNPLRIPAKIESGHQMTVKGWTDAQFNSLRNEWSLQWGNDGETRFDPMLWAPFIYESWAVAKIPDDVLDFIKNLPAQANFHYTWNKDLSLGDPVNDDVKFAQIGLMILGFLQPIPPDNLGYFGPKTAAAVLAYQHARGISPVNANHIGPMTRAALNKDFSL